jgi:hypothetical protein
MHARSIAPFICVQAGGQKTSRFLVRGPVPPIAQNPAKFQNLFFGQQENTMSKSSNDARDRAMRMMNQVWHNKASKLIADASKELGAAFAGDGAELIAESMMTVAIGYELQTKGFRRLSLDLNAIAENFAKLADQYDEATTTPQAGEISTAMTTRH